MKIIQLVSSNFKKIKAIDITPKENVVVVSGKNEQGKSSILDSIWATLESRAIPKKPIREGENRAENELKLGENGVVKYIVKRTFTEKGDYLTVTNAEGTSFSSPQKMLDEFVGNLSFDPLEFMRLKKEQNELLLKIVKFEISTEDLKTIGYEGNIPENPIYFLNNTRQECYNLRTVTNRNLLNIEEQLKVTPKTEPTEKVSVKELFEKKQGLQRAKESIETKEGKNKNRESDIKHLEEQIKKETLDLQNYTIRKEKELEEYIAAQRKALKEYTANTEAEINNLENNKDAIVSNFKTTTEELTAEISKNPNLNTEIAKIDKELQEADEKNEKAALYEKRTNLENEHNRVKKESEVFTEKLKRIDEIKTKIVTSAKMPIEGLAFDGETITHKNIPLSQTSDSEKLKVSLAIAMALNPKLKVIRISDGSLLDSENMQVLKEIAKVKDYQIWIERVDETGKIGFYIEEGEIKS